MTLDTAYAEVDRLVKKFKALSGPARKAFNEDNTRKDFILPLFRALGWETDNSAEVSAEEKVSRGFVDFAFRLNGVPRFFLETKRMSEDLTKPDWVRQTVDYAWIKGVTWALLSDFEGLRVFNADWKEYHPLRAQFIEFTVETYLPEFERLWWLSKPETALGRLDREAEKVGKKIKRLPVNLHLFDDLRAWRQDLFTEFRQYNATWPPAQIDEAVLKLLNRLIFIRTLEDRQVEAVQLKALVHEAHERRDYELILKNLRTLFRRFDDVYDSELFRAGLIDQLYATSQPLEKMINGLYGSSYFGYDFNAIDADVLGAVYEQYLGHIVTNPQAAEVVEKRAKRKSQGIFYTPAFVVKYIVQQTVGKYLAERGYSESHPPRVLDMACGSGSFLIEAFDTLDRFVAARRPSPQPSPDAARHPLPDRERAGVRATIYDHARRLEILQQCIFGVDKDPQAVEVARLNLLLKASFQPARLPLLQNITHADSLRLDWDGEFKEVMKDGGFDIIIGNPPYVRAENMPRIERDYYISSDRFESAYGRFDIHILFVEQAIKMLKEGGRLGFIIPYAGLSQNYGLKMRTLILMTCVVEAIVDLTGYKVFEDASIATCVIVLRKESDVSERINNQIQVIRQDTYDAGIHEESKHHIQQGVFHETPLSTFRLDLDTPTVELVKKIDDRSLKLGDICYLITGAVLHNPATGASKERLIHPSSRKGYKPYIEAKEISRYVPPDSTRFVDFSKPEEMHRQKFPELFENDKIMIARIASGVIATFDKTHTYTDHTILLAVKKDRLVEVKNRGVKVSKIEALSARQYDYHFLLGLINSNLAGFYLNRMLGMAIEINPETARSLPIRRIDFADPADQRQHDAIVALVEEMLQLQKDYAATPPELDDQRAALQKRIARVDAEIDARVYQLYGLTDDEIKMVAGR